MNDSNNNIVNNNVPQPNIPEGVTPLPEVNNPVNSVSMPSPEPTVGTPTPVTTINPVRPVTQEPPTVPEVSIPVNPVVSEPPVSPQVNPMPTVNPAPQIPEVQPINPQPVNETIPPVVPPVNNNIPPIVNTPASPEPVNSAPTEPIAQPANGAPVQETGTTDGLLEAFIGKNYDKITTKPFNVAAFFFSIFYLFYRKMVIYGLLAYILMVAISLVTNNLYISLIINILLGLFANKLYVSFANKKIAKIKAQNTGKTTDELKGICASKGGTSIGLLFLGIIIQGIIMGVVITMLVMMGISTFINSLNTTLENNTGTNTGTETGTNTEAKYAGVLSYNTAINIKDEYTITVPSVFSDNSSTYEYEYSYESGNGIFDKCKIEMAQTMGYTNAEKLITEINEYNAGSEPTDVTNASVNNVEWYSFSLVNSFGKTYYYGTTKNNNVYLLTYSVNQDAASDCESYLEQIINSISSN